MRPFLFSALLSGLSFSVQAHADRASIQEIPISSSAYAASSVNVVAGLQNNLVTDGGKQFTVFYRGDGRVIAAMRPLSEAAWHVEETPLRGDPADAHRTLALAVDGRGHLHLAWNQHNDALRYVRSRSAHAFDFAPAAMIGEHENSVTYPTFLRLSSGDLLFAYREGQSGQGDFVLNRFDVATATWSRVQQSLLDGEGQRSAYPAFYLDRFDTLHLAYVWRESPDVATNHDLAYARSRDQGATWETIEGKRLPLPLTAGNSDYAVTIPQGHNLMNPPSLSADAQGHPFLVNYWSDTPEGIPQLHLVHHDGTAWRRIPVTQRKTRFTLAGTSTKRPPLSRAVVAVAPTGAHGTGVVVLYRDDERAERATLARCRDLDATVPSWTFQELSPASLGGWEPSLDVAQWAQASELHFLIQTVQQRDGEDSPAAALESPLRMLIWAPGE